MNRSGYLLAITSLVAVAAFAQTAQDDTDPKPSATEETTTPATDEAPSSEPSAEATPAEPTPEPGRATMERFVPSEEISDDRSVSFPNDI